MTSASEVKSAVARHGFVNNKMVYNAYYQTVKYRYKTSVCSKATLFLISVFVLTIICPFLIAYKSAGFWLKSDSYLEQPHIRFKHKYLFLVETGRSDTPIFCSTFSQFRYVVPQLQDCSVVKSREVDHNKDGINDEFLIELLVPLSNTDEVFAVKLFLFFDYRLYKLSSLAMESMVYVEHGSSLSGSRFDVFGDLTLVQKTQLSSRGFNSQHNKTIIDNDSILTGDFDLVTLLKEYATRNVSTRLANTYSLWTPSRAINQPFKMTATVFFPEDSITYRPCFWQVMKWAWIQYLSVLVVVSAFAHKITESVFRNQLVVSSRIDPGAYKKPY